MQSSEIGSKRENFRQSIRRRHIESILSERRKQIQLNIHESSLCGAQLEDSGNNLIMKKSLIRNCLNSELSILLPSLGKKIKNNPSPVNVEFVVSVSSNILQDDIPVQSKEAIYQYCSEAIRTAGCRISPLVEVYFFQSVMAACYSSLDEPQQVQIQEWIIDWLIELLQTKEMNMERVPASLSAAEARTECISGILQSLLYFYEPEKDHNCILLYKVKRTINHLSSIIHWMKSELTQIVANSSYKPVLLAWNQIIYNISSISYSLPSLLAASELSVLVQVLAQQLRLQSEDFQEIKALACHSLFSLAKEDSCFCQEHFSGGLFTHLIFELENCVNQDYQLELVRLLGCLVQQLVQREENGHSINNVLECLLSEILKILRSGQELTQGNLLALSLKLIRSVLAYGYEHGNGQFVEHLSRIGALQLLDHLFLRIKQEDLLSIIDQIQHFSNFC